MIGIEEEICCCSSKISPEKLKFLYPDDTDYKVCF